LNPNTFNIYDASAGSGKTFTLVKEYLKILFTSSSKTAYKNILAITFTNKAVGEMKERIIEALKIFANTNVREDSPDMFLAICEELSMTPKELQNKSNSILNSIAHNYAAFDISTIDKFTQKLIRTFAYDLKLPINFEVELDTETVLNEAVDRLISKAGVDKELTKILIDFAFEKADDDKSWDVALDFYSIAKLLVNENDISAIETLKEKSLDDFKTLKKGLAENINLIQASITNRAEVVLTLIRERGLEYNDFSSSYLPKHFKKLADKKFNINFDAKWQEDIESRTLYPKRVTLGVATIIEGIQPQLASAFNETKQFLFQFKFLQNFYKNTTPLSVLNLISNELDALKEEQNILLISEFNAIISNQIKHQPSPFIYERIGEKFRHYFIDEFQDTSVMQWENLIPLLQNALSSENGGVMLVGDAKQAIYRWRGGKAEQFIGLFDDDNPFFAKKNKKHLPANYRSYKEIVGFNNGLFKYLSTFIFSKKEYEELYSNSIQNSIIDKTGYVSLSFLDIDKDDDKNGIYPESVLDTINKCLKNGFSLKDICVLVRKKKEGIAIADYLSDNGIDIVSSETLLLNRSPEVVFINNMLKYILEPKNEMIKVEVINYLADYKFNITDKHSFLKTCIDLDIQQFFEALNTFKICFNYNDVVQLPIYEAIESIIYSFKLVDTSNAYVQFYLDFVLDYSQKNQSSLGGLIDHYEAKKESLSIVSPQGKNAVQIMTIHKSKGLEFPVVVFPYADLDIYRELNPKEWFPLDPKSYYGFSQALLNYNKDFQNYGKVGEQIFIEHQAELELDNINLLYVALTRAIEQLHIISNKQLDKSGNGNLKLYSGMFINYLKHINKWKEDEAYYAFGNPQKTSLEKNQVQSAIEQESFISTPKKEHNINIITNSGFLWDTAQKEAIEKGSLIHNIMSYIKIQADVDIALNKFLTLSTINRSQYNELNLMITNIVEHPELSSYFNLGHTVYNEKDIITKDGYTLRPDRLVINAQNEAIIIDYKTGIPDEKHKFQLEIYGNALQEMNFSVIKKILIYVNDTLDIKEV